MVSFRLPYPEYKGGYILRVLNIARILSRQYQVDLLTLARKEKHSSDLEKIFNKVFLFSHGPRKEYLGALKSFFLRKPLQVGYYYSSEVNHWLKNNYQNYDLVYFNTIRTAEYARGLKITKVLDMMDAISLNYSLAKEWQGFFWRMIYRIEIARTLCYELDIARRGLFDKLFISSPFDKRYLEEKSSSLDKMTVLPNGVDQSLFYKEDIKEKNFISFFGKMDYKPNEDAVIYFSEKIFPLIRKAFPDLEFYIIGINPSKKVKRLADQKGIKVTGFLENPYQLLKESKLTVAPLHFGAGIQNKVLVAMALGKTVVASRIGVRGIAGAENGSNILVEDFNNPEKAAQSIIDILKNAQKRERIGENARDFILRNYHWNKAEDILFSNISDIMK